jgi:hypothetical protein
LVPDPDLVSDPKYIFYDMLDINFTFVFPPFKCVWLLIIMIYKLFRDIFLTKKNLYFFGEIVKFFQFLIVVILQIHFGNGAAQIRIRNYFILVYIRIRILLKLSDPPGSGSTTLLLCI